LQAEIAYVANVANANVSAYSIGAHGSLTSVAGSPFAAGIASISVAVDILGRFVYVANGGDFPAFNGSVSLPHGARFQFRIGGPLGPVRLRGKRGQQQRLSLPPR
jgi:hypothetical protein